MRVPIRAQTQQWQLQYRETQERNSLAHRFLTPAAAAATSDYMPLSLAMSAAASLGVKTFSASASEISIPKEEQKETVKMCHILHRLGQNN